MNKWKDITSYRKSDVNTEPRIFRAEFVSSGFMLGSVTITRNIHYPDTWILMASDFGIHRVDLHTDDAKEAKGNAIALIDVRLTVTKECLGKLSAESGVKNE